jgi:hypothetical protein
MQDSNQNQLDGSALFLWTIGELAFMYFKTEKDTAGKRDMRCDSTSSLICEYQASFGCLQFLKSEPHLSQGSKNAKEATETKKKWRHRHYHREADILRDTGYFFLHTTVYWIGTHFKQFQPGSDSK